MPNIIHFTTWRGTAPLDPIFEDVVYFLKKNKATGAGDMYSVTEDARNNLTQGVDTPYTKARSFSKEIRGFYARIDRVRWPSEYVVRIHKHSGLFQMIVPSLQWETREG